MSILDYMLLIITVTIVVMVLMKKGLQQLLGWLFIDLVVVALHMFFDTIRWQTIPLYILSIIIVLYYLTLQIDYEKIRKIMSKTVLVMLILVVLVSSFSTAAFTIPILEKPSGPFPVGTVVFNISDKDHLETYSDIVEERDLRIQIWYPGVEDETNYANWMIDGARSTAALGEVFGLPSFVTGHLNEVTTHSQKDIKVSNLEESYPVIMMSHGWSSFRNLHLNLAEALASEGYIVVGIDHTYASLITRLEDGSIAKLNKMTIQEDRIVEDGKILIDIFEKDISLVVKTLKMINEDHKILRSKLDMDNLGLLGHSTGAAAQIQYASKNSVKAVFSMDPWLEPIEINPINAPIEVFRSEEWANQPNDEHIKQLVESVYQIDGTKHVDFTMMYKLAPFFKWINKVTGDYGDIQAAYVLAFFDEYLKEEPKRELYFENVHIVEVQ